MSRDGNFTGKLFNLDAPHSVPTVDPFGATTFSAAANVELTSWDASEILRLAVQVEPSAKDFVGGERMRSDVSVRTLEIDEVTL